MERTSAAARGSRAARWVPALLIALALLQLLPHLTEVDFHREEGRRVLPAREMIQSGNWVVPTLWGQPYLNKPPGIFWLQAAAQMLGGGLSTWAARLVSVAATLATLLALWWTAGRWFSARAGALAALLFLVSPEVVTKARLAEIEAPLALAVFLALACSWRSRTGPWLWSVAAGLALAAAVFLKGPAALVFFLGPWLLLALARREARSLLSGRLGAALLLGLGLPALWAWALFRQVGAGVATAQWSSQVGGQGGHDLAQYLGERASFVPGALLGAAPASLVLLVGLGTTRGRELLRSPGAGQALAMIVAGLGFFLVFPGTRVRYIYPALPFVALLAGALLDRALLAQDDARLWRRLAALSTAFGVLGLVLVAALGVASLHPLGDIEVGWSGLCLAVLLAAASVAALRAGGGRKLAWALFGVPLIVSHVLTGDLESAKAERHARAPIAAAIDARLGAGEALHVAFWDNFNTLLHLRHEVRYEPEWREVPAGSWLLLGEAQLDELEREFPRARYSAPPWRVEIWEATRVLLRLEERGPPAPEAQGAQPAHPDPE